MAVLLYLVLVRHAWVYVKVLVVAYRMSMFFGRVLVLAHGMVVLNRPVFVWGMLVLLLGVVVGRVVVILEYVVVL